MHQHPFILGSTPAPPVAVVAARRKSNPESSPDGENKIPENETDAERLKREAKERIKAKDPHHAVAFLIRCSLHGLACPGKECCLHPSANGKHKTHHHHELVQDAWHCTLQRPKRPCNHAVLFGKAPVP